MEVDEIQRQVSKFQRVSSNGSSTTTTDHNLLLNNHKIATSRSNQELKNHHVDDSGGIGVGGGASVGVGGGIARLCGWPSSRIVRVSRASGGKDRHSKVLTSKGLRDRRVRLSVSTAIQFYDLQDRLGFDQPSKAVEWLLKAAASSIDELPSLDPSFSGVLSEQCQDNRVQVGEEKKVNEHCNEFEDLNFHHHQVEQHQQQNNSNNNKNDVISEMKWKAQSKSNSKSKSPDCSSTSETSKGSGLSLSRSENRMKARERAREMASKKEKNIVLNHTQQNNLSENSSFTDLLTSGINTSVRRSPETRNHWSTTQPPPPQPMDYFFTRPPPQFNITAIDNHHHHHHNHFSFLQDGFIPTAVPTTTTGGNGESYNLNFSMTSSSSAGGGVALAPGFSRGTLQSNLPYLQRFQSSSSIDGSPSTNLPFFIVPNNVSDHFQATTGGYHLSYGGGGGGGGDHHHKDKSKN